VSTEGAPAAEPAPPGKFVNHETTRNKNSYPAHHLVVQFRQTAETKTHQYSLIFFKPNEKQILCAVHVVVNYQTKLVFFWPFTNLTIQSEVILGVYHILQVLTIFKEILIKLQTESMNTCSGTLYLLFFAVKHMILYFRSINQ
jgi:hypothetical protein